MIVRRRLQCKPKRDSMGTDRLTLTSAAQLSYAGRQRRAHTAERAHLCWGVIMLVLFEMVDQERFIVAQRRTPPRPFDVLETGNVGKANGRVIRVIICIQHTAVVLLEVS